MNDVVSKLTRLVKQDENYIPRDYKTIGGMWTVDTWKRSIPTIGTVVYQIMDEGSTTVIAVEDFGIEILNDYNGINFLKKGNVLSVSKLKNLLTFVKETTTL